MPEVYSIVIKSEWIEPIIPYLEGLLTEKGSTKGIRVDRGTARQCLSQFEDLTSVMGKMNTDWAQGSFTTKEMNLIHEVASFLDLEDIKRRFSL